MITPDGPGSRATLIGVEPGAPGGLSEYVARYHPPGRDSNSSVLDAAHEPSATHIGEVGESCARLSGPSVPNRVPAGAGFSPVEGGGESWSVVRRDVPPLS